MTKPLVVTFGELMLRLSPPGNQRFAQASTLDMSFGGGEANVAVGLSLLGTRSAFVTALPTHEIGDAAVASLARYGVDTSRIVRQGDRIGTYFLEHGASQRPSKVIYDRAHAAVTELDASTFDASAALDGASWFHFTGITPALGSGPASCILKLCQAARRAGVKISCDLNFRSKLWTPDEARAFMKPIMAHVDVCIANEEDMQQCLGLEPDRSDVHEGTLDEAGYLALARRARDTFGFERVAITMRESLSASRNGWSAVLVDREGLERGARSIRYDIQVVDRVGAGDAFAAGLIHALVSGRSGRDALEFAVAASCLKHSIPGDFNLATEAEVEKLVSSGGSGRVER